MDKQDKNGPEHTRKEGKTLEHDALINHRPCRPLLPFGKYRLARRRTSRHKPTPFFLAYLLIQENIRLQRMLWLGEIPGAPLTACTEPYNRAELLSEYGYFGVQESVIRLAKFAMSTAANDPGRLNQVRQGLIKGLADMEKQWGTLPEISYRTVDTILEKLDAWKESLLSPSDTEPTPL